MLCNRLGLEYPKSTTFQMRSKTRSLAALPSMYSKNQPTMKASQTRSMNLSTSSTSPQSSTSAQLARPKKKSC